MPSEPDAELMFIGQPYNPTPRLLQSGLDFFNDNIGDLYDGPVPPVWLDPTSTRNLPLFVVAPPDPSRDFMLFQQPQPQVLVEEYFWDPEPVWQFLVDSPGPLQSDIFPGHMMHFVEDDLVQEETRVLGECFLPSTIDKLVDSVADPTYDPVLNIIDEDQPHLVVSPPEDYSIMVTDLVPPVDLWDVDEIVDVQVGAEVWAVNCSLAEGGLWDVPFTTNPEPEVEVAVVQDLNF
ncbi:hypothetical protein RHMOL_Rhmol02G0180600 [Rhododendron molle]|uniref:Uncharacterized protein n=1 Tax=Rhododendron molle TaxID=49168 RepID=A0ACC0PSV1_RHOML|nr:hypothetical protein RHMOL_Rhmol02G0180600 [Rhododendron molle]